MAIKTNWNEVNQIIKEEFQRLMTKNKLKARVKQINEELGQMDTEDASLEEVEAAGSEKVSSHAWTGKANGDEKFKPKFEKKGSHLLEDEDEETLEIGSEEDMEIGGEEGAENGDLNLADEFAELGAAIEAKIKAVLGGETAEVADDEITVDGDGDGDSSEEFEEVEVDADGGIDAGAEDSEGAEGAEDDEEIDEYAETQGGVGAEQGMTADQALQKENKKKTGKVIAESKETKKSPYLNILSEGLDKNQKTALQIEVERMRKLAKLDNNE